MRLQAAPHRHPSSALPIRQLRLGNKPQERLAAIGIRQRGLRAVCETPTAPPPLGRPASRGLLQGLARCAGVAGMATALALGAGVGAAEAARSGGRMGGAAFGGSRFSSGGFGSSAWGASSSTGTWGGRSAFGGGGAMGSGWGGSSRLGAYRSGGAGPLTGGFGSSFSTPSSGVRTNAFFLSPFGFGEWRRRRPAAVAAAASPCQCVERL